MKKLDEIKQQVNQSQEFLNELQEYLGKSLLIEGKTMREWKRHFYIKIPDEITFPSVIILAAEVAQKYQEAASYRDEQTVQLTILEQTRADKYNEAYNKARTQSTKSGKPLAAESCKVAACLEVQEIESALSSQRVIRDFWTKTCDTLVEIRKLLETVGRALGGDAWTNRDFVVKGQ